MRGRHADTDEAGARARPTSPPVAMMATVEGRQARPSEQVCQSSAGRRVYVLFAFARIAKSCSDEFDRDALYLYY